MMSDGNVGPGLKLHRLASLPTTTPESAGLCALAWVSIVSASLKTQRSGLATRVQDNSTTAFFSEICIGDLALWRLYVGDLRVYRAPVPVR